MGLSVLIPWRDNGDIYRQRSFEWLLERYAVLLPAAEVVIGSDDSEPFNRSAARNDAFSKSSGDVLLVADADTIFHAAQIAKAVTMVREGLAAWVIPYGEDLYFNLTEKSTKYVLCQPPDVDVPEPADERIWEHKITSWAGLLVLPRTAWETVGGYDEAFIAWGYEDNAFRVALDRKVGPFRRVDGFTAHLWHPAPESECFGQPHITENQQRFRMYERGLL